MLKTDKERQLSFLGIMLGMVSSILMQTIIATVLPAVTYDLGQETLYGWIFSSYMIASTITIPLFSNLSDMYGRKSFYLCGMVLFLIGTILSGFSQSMTQLIIFRMIQGIGAGAIAPSAIAMISELYAPELRVKMLGLLSAIQVLANIVGPLLGGLITDIYNWRFTFFINIPIGVIAFLLIMYNFVEKRKEEEKNHKAIDYSGSILLGLSIILFLLFFQQEDHFNLKQLSLLAAAIVVFIGFIIQEKKHENPILSLDLIKIKNVKYSFISMLLSGMSVYGLIAILPLYGQSFLGPQAFAGGKILLLFSVGVGLGGILSGRLSNVLNIPKLVSFSWLLSMVGLFMLVTTKIYFINVYLHFSFVIMIGIGLGINLPVILASSQNAVDENKQAVIGGLIQISRNIGGAISIPILTHIIISLKNNDNVFYSFHLTFFLLAILSLIGLFVGIRFDKKQILGE